MFNDMLTHVELAYKYSILIAPFFALVIVGLLGTVFKFRTRWKK